MKTLALALAAILAVAAGYVWMYLPHETGEDGASLQTVTLSGTYLCLPPAAGTAPTDDCSFGLQADDGTFYAVNFGQSAAAMQQFRRNEHITAEGFLVPKETLNSDTWQRYDFKAIFTITKLLSPQAAPVQGKLDIRAVCQGALSYMTFTDGDASAKFVAECIEGKHPEVIERYRKDMNLGDGAAI